MKKEETYTLSEELSIATFQFLDLIEDLFLESNVTIVNMLGKFLDSYLHGFRRA